MKCWTTIFCIHASKSPVITMHQLNSIYNSSPSQINIHTPFAPVCRWLLVMRRPFLLAVFVPAANRDSPRQIPHTETFLDRDPRTDTPPPPPTSNGIHCSRQCTKFLTYSIITSFYLLIWRPDQPMNLSVSDIVGGVNGHNSTVNMCLCRWLGSRKCGKS